MQLRDFTHLFHILILPKEHYTTNDGNAVHSERLGIYNLAKKAHGITNGANAVHSERMGIYNLAKKGHHITNDANAVHSTVKIYR